jgi:hypothetical protein
VFWQTGKLPAGVWLPDQVTGRAVSTTGRYYEPRQCEPVRISLWTSCIRWLLEAYRSRDVVDD